MHSLLTENKPADLVDTLKQLLNCEKITLLGQKGGGNSLVYCVEVNGEKFAVKSYPPYAPGKRDRLAAEVMAYQFLNKHHVQSVPRLKHYCADSRLLVMEWLDGDMLEAYSTQDLDQAIHFIASVASLNALPEARQLPQAAEACLSLSTLIHQITERLRRLQKVSEPNLLTFLSEEFTPVFIDIQERAKIGYRSANLDTQAELVANKHSLVPSDFGFHNAIRVSGGELFFFDFDYFGWDDPVKLLADILWHPKMHFNEEQKEYLIQGIATIYRADTTFMTRFQYTLALFGLRWTLIFLNEFLSEFWQNRQHAGVHANQASAKVQQLERARSTLQQVKKIGTEP